MSLSFGATSFTMLSAIEISPSVISSNPATILSKVVLPQPEGPTSTKNSPSLISIFTSSKARVPLG